MLRARKIVFRTAAALGSMLLLVALILVGLYLYVQTDSGRSRLAHLATERLSGDSFTLELERLNTLGTDAISLSGVRIGDKEGTWLSLDTLDISWHPIALFRGQIHISELILSQVLITRIPSFSDSNNSAEGSVSLPLAMRVDQLKSDDVLLEQGVLGQKVSLRIEGNAKVTGSHQVAGQLMIERTDKIEGNVDLAIEYDLSTNQLDINGDIYDGPGGFLSTAHDFQGVNVSIAGSGPITHWAGTASAVSGKGAKAEADLKFSNKGESSKISITGSAEVASLIQISLRELVDSGVHFTLEASFDKGKNAVIETGRISSDAALLEVAGEMSNSQAALEASAQLTDLGASWLNTQFPGFEGKGLTLQAQATGPMKNIAAQLEFSANSLSALSQNHTPINMENVVLNLTADFDLGSGEFVMPTLVGSQGRIDRFSSSDESLQKILSGPLSFSVNSQVDPEFSSVRLTHIDVTTGWAQIDGQGTVELKQSETGIPQGIGAINFDFETAVPALAHFNPITGQYISGAATIRTDIEMSGSSDHFNIALEGAWDQPALDIPNLDAALGDRIDFSGVIKGTVEDSLEFSDLRLVSNTAAIEGGLTYSPSSQDLQSEFLIQIPELADSLNLANDIRGKVSVSISASGSAGDPAINALVKIEDLFIDELSAQEIDAEISIDNAISDPNGDLRVVIQQQQIGTAKLKTLFRVAEFKQISFSGIKFEALDLRAAGDLLIPFSQAPLEGTLTGSISSLSSMSELIGQDLAGDASFSFSLEKEQFKQRLVATAKINQGEVRIPGSANTVVKNIDVKANLLDPFESVTGQVQIGAQGVQFHENTIDQLDLIIQPIGFNAADVDISVSGKEPEPYKLSATGNVERNQKNLIASLNMLNLGLEEFEVELENPVLVSISPQEIVVSDISLLSTHGSLLASGRLSDEEIKADISAQGLELSLLRGYRQDLEIEGKLSGEFQIEGALSSPSGKLRLQADNIRSKEGDAAGLKALTANLVGTLADNQLHLDGEIEGAANTEISATASIPLQPGNDNSFPTLSQTSPLDAELTWVGPLREVVEYLSMDQHSMTGNADIKLRLNGRADAISMSGFARLRDGVYENFQTGALIKNLTLDIDDNKSGIKLVGSGNDSAGGSIQLRGSLDMAPGEWQKFLVDLDVELERFLLVRLDQLSASVNGKIELDGNLSELNLTSQLSTEQVDASLTAAADAQVESLEVIEKNISISSPNAVSSSSSGSGLVPVNLDLALRMPRRVFLRGGGLDTEWSGNLEVTGTAQHPVVSGALEPLRGGYRLFGKQFSLNTGSVRFDGSAEFDPVLNLPFEYQGSDFIATLTISGSASTPEILLSSRPSMPDSEIVSRILFERDSNTLTTAQKLQLAGALASVRNGNLSVLERSRDRLGLDVLSLNESDNQNTTVTAGRYLTERVYLEVGSGADRTDRSATVEVKISPNLRLETGTKGGETGRVGLRWRWDY